MGNIVITTNTTLDGIVQDPDGEEGFDRGGWFRQFGGKDLEPWNSMVTTEALAADALLLGRRSEAWFGQRWSSRSGELADRLNTLPKYVVSTTYEETVWNNTTLLVGDLATHIANLKQQVNGDVLVYASYQLGQSLLERGLVDELRLFLFPVVLGSGKRLFDETHRPTVLRLVETRSVGENLVWLNYKRG
jgi:dihydrofolate reductase